MHVNLTPVNSFSLKKTLVAYFGVRTSYSSVLLQIFQMGFIDYEDIWPLNG